MAETDGDVAKIAKLNEAQAATTEEINLNQYAQKKVDAWLQANSERVKTWLRAHPNQRMPVFYDEKEDRVVWLNRKQRQFLKRAQKQSRKRALSKRSNPPSRAPIPRPNR